MMKSNWSGTRNDDGDVRPRRSPRRREAERARTLRGLIASIAVGGLLVVGLPTMAFAEAIDPTTDSTTSAETEESTDPATPVEPAEPTDAAVPTEGAAEVPSEEPSEAPAEETPAEEVPSEEPSEAPAEEAPTEAPEQAPAPLKSSKAVAPLASADAVVALVDPTTTTSVVRVTVGDDRSLANAGTINPLPGVTLALFSTETGGSRLADPWATCVSDATGICEFVIPNTGDAPNNANRDRELWVRQVGAPTGYFANTLIRTGDADGGNSAQTPYSYRIGANTSTNPANYNIRGGNVYTSTSNFMVGTGNSNRKASGGTWQTSRNNIALPQQCGLDVALVMDLSGSVSPSIVQARAAGVSLVQALGGTPSRVGLFTFGATAPQSGVNNQNRPITAVSTAAGVTTVSGWINGLTATGSTNWDRGIYQVATNAASYDVAIVLTDGNPTVYGTESNPGDFTRTREVENAIFSANAVKQEGTRVIALGVGSGVTSASTALNLAAISGPTKYNGSNSAEADYYQEASYSAAAEALRALALGNCTGGVSVVKQVIPPGGTIANAQPAAGWAVSANNTNPGTITVGTPNPANGQTDNTGAVNYPLDFPGGVSGTVTIRETQQAGYTIAQQGGFNAVCRDLATVPATNVAVTNASAIAGQPGVVVPVSAASAISCTFYNQAPNPSAQIVVNKLWAVNGQPAVPHGSQDPSLSGISTINGAQVGFGNQTGGFTQGQVIPVGESLGTLPTLCTIDSQRLTRSNGNVVNVDVSGANTYAATLAGGLNTYEITNTVTCPTKLTLLKQVQGGPAARGDWTLTSLPPVDGPGGPYLPGPTGSDTGSGVVANVTPTAYYPLAETGNTANTALYTQVDNRNPDLLVPGSTGSWNCVTLNANGGTGGAGSNAGGLNGGVRVPFGTWVGCTAVNQTSQVELRKVVDAGNGGSAVPADWDLRTTPTSTAGGEVTTTVKSGATVFLRPGSTYGLSELNGPGGYNQESLQCNIGQNDAYVDVTDIRLVATDSAICVFTNIAELPRLSLTKIVDNQHGGDGVAADWTVSASALDGGFSGPGTASDLVEVGVGYTLNEVSTTWVNGVEYEVSATWSCTSESGEDAFTLVSTPGSTSATLTVNAYGASVDCGIENTDIAPNLELEKIVAPDEVVADFPPTLWTLSASLDGTAVVEGAGSASGQVQSNVAYDLAESADFPEADEFTPGAWECLVTSEDPAVPVVLDDDAVMLEPGQNVSCSITNTAAPVTYEVDKTVSSTVQQPDGTWLITYEITVANASGVSPLTYDLVDDLSEFGVGITIDEANWSGDNGESGSWEGLDEDPPVLETTFVTDYPLDAGATDTYEVEVVATVTEEAWSGESTTCTTGEGFGQGGFRNVAEVTIDDLPTIVTSCDQPGTSTAVKSVLGEPFYNGDGTFDVVYEITVTNDSEKDQYYDLIDTPAFPAGTTFTAEATDPDGDAVEDWTGIAPDGAVLADGRELPASSTEVWTVTATVDVTTISDTDDATCLETSEGHGFFNDGEYTTGTITMPIADCADIPIVDVGIEKAAELPEGVAAVDDTEDAAFDWVLTVTNNGLPVQNLEVTDLIDPTLEITGPATFEAPENWTESTVDNQFTANYAGTFEEGQVTTITIPVRLLPAVVEAPPTVGPDDPAPVLPEFAENQVIPNTACVATGGSEPPAVPTIAALALEVPEGNIGDVFSDNDCADAEVPVKKVDAGAYVRCVADVPWLHYDVRATENVEPGDITVTWTSADGTQTKVETIPWDQREGRLLWPGAAVDADGLPYQFPGWRPITEEDLTNPPTPGTRFLDLILDDSLPSYAWRDMENPASIEFSVNPSQTVLAVYPQALPSCAVDRPAELEIDKTASVTSTKAGDDYSYSLQVTSVGTGATNPTEVFDEIPADLRVDEITTAPAPAFPRWEDCEVTGQDSGGYGGTLHCDLLGQLGPNFLSAPVIDLAVHVREGATAQTIDNTGEVCWQTADDPDPVTECADDTVSVTLLGGTAVTGFAAGPWIWGAAGLLVLGGLAVTWVIIRRRREADGS